MLTKLLDALASFFWNYLDNKGRNLQEISRGQSLIIMATVAIGGAVSQMIHLVHAGLMVGYPSLSEHHLNFTATAVFLFLTIIVIIAAKRGYILPAAASWMVVLFAAILGSTLTNVAVRAQEMVLLFQFLIMATGFIIGARSALIVGLLCVAVEVLLFRRYPDVIAPDVISVNLLMTIITTGLIASFVYTYMRPAPIRRAPADRELPADQFIHMYWAGMSSNLETIENPVAVMSSLADRLLTHYQGNLDDAGLEIVRSISENGRLAMRYIHDTTSLVELPHSDWMVSPQHIDPSSVMHLIVNEVDDRVRQRGLVLRYQLDPHLPSKIFQDTRLIRRATLAVVDNAIRNTETGCIEIRLTRAADPQHFCITIQDTGVGLTTRRLEEIRLMLANGLQIIKQGGVKAGMGLALADRITKRLGGRLEIAGAVALGTTVTMVLPIRCPMVVGTPS